MGLFDKIKSAFNSKQEAPKEAEKNVTSFVVRYEMVWKEDVLQEDRDFNKTTCCNESGFCRILMEMNKVYTRTDIEQITARLGYSVFDNIGGSTNEEGFPICCCTWKSVVLVKK